LQNYFADVPKVRAVSQKMRMGEPGIFSLFPLWYSVQRYIKNVLFTLRKNRINENLNPRGIGSNFSESK